MEHPTPSRTPMPRHNISRFLPFLILVLIGLFILKDQVPWINHWFQSIVAPERYASAEACRHAAMDAATQPDYARVKNEGTVHKTLNGFYVDGVIIGEMGADGAETTYRFSCYADAAGKLVKTHKDTTTVLP